MQHELHNIQSNAISLILNAETAEELEDVKLQFLGKSGTLTLAMKEVARLPKEKRPEAGKVANEVKQLIEEAIKEKAQTFTKKTISKLQDFDITEPGIRPTLGHLHLVTQAIREITKIFEHIGYTRVRYPEIEWDWYAFTSLNFPDNHPARDDWETFFIKQKPDAKMGPVVLTPHTSSGQVREMQHQQLPPSPSRGEGRGEGRSLNIKMLNIAKTYRRQSDVSHTPMFHQFEGLVVGEDISIADLKGTLDYFVKSYLGEKRATRIRPYHFQFTEPSFEVDVSCGVCLGKARLPDGQGCKLCKEGWLEVGGAGMVHPNVLKFGSVDPKKHSGFAFGFGVERMVMMKDGIEIDDLRTLYGNALDFLNQF